jgi:sugar/nucleoside kinase (ribokinase family)
MVTGFDISLEQLKKLRSNYSGLIYFDVHTLSRGLDENNNRNFRTIPYFEHWAKCVDILQVNTNELFTLSNLQTEHEIVTWLLSLGVTAIIITLDEKGAKYYYSDRGEKASYFQSAFKVETKNKIGCGDVFGAVFIYHYLKNKNLNSALSYANCAAGCIASYSDIKLIKNLKNDIIRRTN